MYTQNQIHHGKNIKRLRELLGLKQEVIAIGLDITQQSVSEIEQKKFINENTLKKIADILQIPVETIEYLNEKLIADYTKNFVENIFSNKKKVFEGRVIKILREYLNISLKDFASKLDITEQEASELEQKEIIADPILEKIAKTLNVPVEAIKNMSDEATYNYINTFNDKVESSFLTNTINCTFNPIDKIVELYNEKEALYERMLKEKEALIEKFLNK